MAMEAPLLNQLSDDALVVDVVVVVVAVVAVVVVAAVTVVIVGAVCRLKLVQGDRQLLKRLVSQVDTTDFIRVV